MESHKCDTTIEIGTRGNFLSFKWKQQQANDQQKDVGIWFILLLNWADIAYFKLNTQTIKIHVGNGNCWMKITKFVSTRPIFCLSIYKWNGVSHVFRFTIIFLLFLLCGSILQIFFWSCEARKIKKKQNNKVLIARYCSYCWWSLLEAGNLNIAQSI